MQINWSSSAEKDLEKAINFFEKQNKGLGAFFLESISIDVEKLSNFGGIHSKYYGFYRFLTSNFTFAIYYTIKNNKILVISILDTRRNPSLTKSRLKDVKKY